MKQETSSLVVPAIVIIAAVIFIVMLAGSAISFLTTPAKYTEDQQRALSLASYLGYHSLGEDSVNHYSGQKVHENGVAGIMYKYRGGKAMDLEQTMHDKLEGIGFATTEITKAKNDRWDTFWEYSYFSAENGDIIAYITTYYDRSNKYICIAAGPGKSADDVFKVRVEGADNIYLKSDVRYKSGKTADIEHVAPLAGTIYAIKYPQHKLSGPRDAKVNVDARKSYEVMLALKEKVTTNETFQQEFFNDTADNETAVNRTYSARDRTRYYPWGFFWVSGGGRHYSPYRYDRSGSGATVRPRGTGYTVRGAGGPGIAK